MKGISIIIPVYNREKYIAEAIQSVISQNFKGNLEIIISDDGSTDKTLEIVRSFGDKVKILTSKQMDHGAARARNRGLHFATQPYIAFLDSDDFYLPNHLNRITSILDLNPKVDFAFCRSLQVKVINGEKFYKPWSRERISKNDVKNLIVSGSNVVNTNCFVFKKHIFKRIPGFNEVYSNSEDDDLWMRISELFKGRFINYYGVAYRVNHGGNQLTTKSKAKIFTCNLQVNAAAIRRYYQLSLKDPYRIYSLKHARIHLKYFNNKTLRYIHYLLLIFRYPFAFIKWIPFYWDKFLGKKEVDEWHLLSFFLKNN